MTAEEFFEAIADGDLALLRAGLAGRPDLCAATCSPGYAPDSSVRCTALHRAVHANRPDVARLLLDAGADIEARSTEGRTALHDSIELGAREITEMLLERGATLDVCSAAILGRVERLRALLDADPGLANDRSTGLSPLGWASFGNAVETAKELIARGARIDDGELLCAASVGHVEVGRLLIDSGADVDEPFGKSGDRALHAAAAMRYTHDSRRFVELLLDAGAEINARTSHGQTALAIAEAGSRREAERPSAEAGERPRNYAGVAALLRERGASC